MEALDPVELQALKDKHGEIFQLDVEDKSCILRKPKRKELAVFQTVAQKNSLGASEQLLRTCFIQGDNEILDNDAYMLGAISELQEIIEVKAATIKKL